MQQYIYIIALVLSFDTLIRKMLACLQKFKKNIQIICCFQLDVVTIIYKRITLLGYIVVYST